MKKVLITFLMLLLLSGTSLQAQDQAITPKNPEQDRLAMYYFHTSFRCTTCRTVEEQSKLAFESLYPDRFRDGTATFQAVNIDEEGNAELVGKYKIAGQTLLVVKGDQTADLTSQGFLYAKTNPEKLKEEIRKAIESL